MSATPAESHDAPNATGLRSPLNDDPIVLLLYGEEHVNLALADELVLDGYEVRRASDTAKLRAVCSEWEVELVIFGRATRRGAGLDVLRKLRAGAFMPEAKRGLRTLWMTPNGDLGNVLRGFEAGADDVLRAPFAYPELRARVQALVRRDLAEGPCVIEYGELRIDTAAHEVTIGASPVALRTDPDSRHESVWDSAVLESLIVRGSDGQGPLTVEQLRHAFGAKKKQTGSIIDALDRLEAAGLIERRAGRLIASEVAKDHRDRGEARKDHEHGKSRPNDSHPRGADPHPAHNDPRCR